MAFWDKSKIKVYERMWSCLIYPGRYGGLTNGDLGENCSLCWKWATNLTARTVILSALRRNLLLLPIVMESDRSLHDFFSGVLYVFKASNQSGSSSYSHRCIFGSCCNIAKSAKEIHTNTSLCHSFFPRVGVTNTMPLVPLDAKMGRGLSWSSKYVKCLMNNADVQVCKTMDSYPKNTEVEFCDIATFSSSANIAWLGDTRQY